MDSFEHAYTDQLCSLIGLTHFQNASSCVQCLSPFFLVCYSAFILILPLFILPHIYIPSSLFAKLIACVWSIPLYTLTSMLPLFPLTYQKVIFFGLGRFHSVYRRFESSSLLIYQYQALISCVRISRCKLLATKHHQIRIWFTRSKRIKRVNRLLMRSQRHCPESILSRLKSILLAL
jgi:hypothetical protein